MPVFQAAISRDEINLLPIFRYGGPIHLVRDARGAREAIAALGRERVLGFDTETRAAFRKGESYPPALVQLAGSAAVYLFQLQLLRDHRWFDLVLGDGGVVKAGVNVARDLEDLRGLRRFTPAGFVELAMMSDEAGIAMNGIRGMAAVVLGCRVSKGAQRTNWASPDLSPAQLVYAATDAWICRELYLKLAGGVR